MSETVRIFDVPESAYDYQSHTHAESHWLSTSNMRETADLFSTETGVDVKYKAFSSSARVSTERIRNDMVATYRTDLLSQTMKMRVTLNTLHPHQLLTPEAKRFLLEEPPEKIVETVGEFYAHKLTLGGIFQATFVKEQSESESVDSFESEVRASAKFLLGSVSGYSKVGTTSAERELLESVSVNYEVQGGDTSIWLGLTGDNMDEIQTAWAASVSDDNLFPVSFGLRPIWTLLEDDDMDPSKAKELETYLTTKWNEEYQAIPLPPAPDAPEPVMYNTEYMIENEYATNPGKRWLQQSSIRGKDASLTLNLHHVTTKQAVFKLKTVALEGSGPVKYGDEVVIESVASPGYYLQRDGKPEFTDHKSRISMKAAVWTILDTSLKGSGPVHVGDAVVIENAHSGRYWLTRCCDNKAVFNKKRKMSEVYNRKSAWNFKKVIQGL